MKALYVELTDELAAWINDTCDQEGYDYGPLIGVLLSLGLYKYAMDSENLPLSDMSLNQYLLSAKLAGFQPDLLRRFTGKRLPF